MSVGAHPVISVFLKKLINSMSIHGTFMKWDVEDWFILVFYFVVGWVFYLEG